MSLENNPLSCVYCSSPFGIIVRWKGKQRSLYRVKDHFYPAKAGGRRADNAGDNLVWCCQICNHIKHALVFDTGVDARNYILDKLLDSDWCILE